LRVGSDFVQPSTSVRDLGIFIDADLTMRTQVRRTVAERCIIFYLMKRFCLGVLSGGYYVQGVVLNSRRCFRVAQSALEVINYRRPAL